MGLEIIKKCPICDHTMFESFLTCEDSMLSHEHFQLKKCQSCSFVFTSPRPDKASLPAYYQSLQYISHTGKSAGPLDRIYIFARNFTLRWKTALIKEHKSKIALLDYGCGTGEFLRFCQRERWEIAGIEPSADARQKAAQITGINIASDLETFSRQKFDVITLWHVLEHVSDLTNTISRLASLLKADGLIFIAVPNHESNDASHYKQYWAAYDVPRHLWHFTKTTMAALLHSADLKIKTIQPMKLDAYYVSLLSEKYISSNHLSSLPFLKGTIRGFLSNWYARSSTNYSSLIYIVTK